jgi:PKD repeat protein
VAQDKGTTLGMNLRRGLARVLSAAAVVAAVVALSPGQAQAAAGDIGYKDQSFTAAVGNTAPTADKPESKLWWAYNTWWADMWSESAAAHHIFKLDVNTQAWTDTGTAIDTRPNTQSTTLYDGNQLYIASHVVAASSTASVTGNPTNLYRYTYANGAWMLDANFPVAIQPYSVESLSMDIDGAGRLWAAYTRGAKVYLTVTTGTAYTPTVSFATPWIPTVTQAGTAVGPANTAVTADDIATVVATASGDVMVLWSDQVKGAIDYAVHTKAAADTAFTGGQAVQGTKLADDHLNLKALQSDAKGRVFAGVKTSLNDVTTSVPTDPLLRLMVFTPADGAWATYTFSTIADSQTRPLVLIDSSHNTLHMLATGPTTAGAVAYSGTIYEKVTSLDAPSFAAGPGTPVIRDAASADMNNATSTRQPLTATSGEVVMASNTTTLTYWHLYASLADAAPVASFTPDTTSGTAPLTVKFADTSTNYPSQWAWDFGDGSTDVVQNPTHTYTAAGTYTVKLTATNGKGSNAVTKTGLITVTAPANKPTASFTASPATGTAPLAVSFTDTSTGGPTSWLWNFGDSSAAAMTQNASHTYTAAGTYTATLTATNTQGSSTTTQTVTVSAAATGTSTTLYRVNAGGAAITASPNWTPDTTAAPSTYTNAAVAFSAAESNTKVITMTKVPAGTPAALFATDRYDKSTGKTMQWNFPVPKSGTYTLRLYFAETNSAVYGKGLRKFGIKAEGATLVASEDIYAEVGAKTALMKTFNVTVTDGVLSLEFIRIANNPIVNGIEVIGPA